MAFSSSFGQTFFVGIFGPELQREFGLSHTTWGTIYLVGTLASSLVLPTTGKLIDSMDLRKYTLWVCLSMAFACLFTPLFVTGPLTLAVAIFLLRQTGQGLASHTAVTTMARYFDRDRGRAIAMATIGFSVGEALLPLIAVLLIATWGWRWAYGTGALFLVLLMTPALLWLLKGHGERHIAHIKRLSAPADTDDKPVASWTRAEILRDKRFYLVLPAFLAPSYVLTAMFFHHLNLADAKGWSHTWMTGSYVIYAAVAMLTAILAGQLVDRYRAIRVIPYMMAFLFASMVAAALGSAPWTLWIYLALAAISSGVSHTAGSALWAEVYGVSYIGAIKSLATALGVFASALGPITLGVFMDFGLPIEAGCWFFAGYAVLTTGFIFLARLDKPLAPPSHAG